MLNQKKTALAVGSFVALVHIAWSLLVALSWAQPLSDFIAKIHMVAPVVVVQSFNLGTALSLIVVTGLVGAIAGYAFATVWNKVGGR
ncbi:MAG: hypothetical protein AAB955_00910 [Patescibacteria group bacterium]